MLFLLYPPCSTCKKAKKWLDEHGVAYEARDIKQDNPTQEELRAWQARSGLPLKRFFNTSGQLYRSLQLKEKLPAMLVKRPLAVGEDFVLVGFKEAEWEQTLLK